MDYIPFCYNMSFFIFNIFVLNSLKKNINFRTLLFAAFSWHAFSFLCLIIAHIGIVLCGPSLEFNSFNIFIFLNMRETFGQNVIMHFLTCIFFYNVIRTK